MLRTLFLLFVNLTGINAQTTRTPVDTLHVQLLSNEQERLFGAYVVNKNKHHLITTSDENGCCHIPQLPEWKTDTIEFAYLGFSTRRIAFNDLKNNMKIKLKPNWKTLETVTIEGIHPNALLKKVAQQLKAKRQKHEVNFYGKALYEKITECNERAVGFLQEYGYYFTSGHVPQKEKWDLKYFLEIIPIHAARSHNFLPDGEDTLTRNYLNSGRFRYDVYYKKIFHAIRAVQLFGPLFCDSKYYDITPLESENGHYLFAFATKKEYFPSKTRVYGRGTLEIDRETHQIKRIYFDYLDYHFYRLVHRHIPNPPFASTLELSFAYDENGPHVQSARLTTTWKHNENKISHGGIEMPSRRNPAKNQLVEKEAFHCVELTCVPEEKQLPYLVKMVNLASKNPQPPFSEQIFQMQLPLLERDSAFKQLSQSQDLLQQFILHGNKPYYKNYFNLDPTISPELTKDPRRFIEKARKDVLERFAYQ